MTALPARSGRIFTHIPALLIASLHTLAWLVMLLSAGDQLGCSSALLMRGITVIAFGLFAVCLIGHGSQRLEKIRWLPAVAASITVMLGVAIAIHANQSLVRLAAVPVISGALGIAAEGWGWANLRSRTEPYVTAGVLFTLVSLGLAFSPHLWSMWMWLCLGFSRVNGTLLLGFPLQLGPSAGGGWILMAGISLLVAYRRHGRLQPWQLGIAAFSVIIAGSLFQVTANSAYFVNLKALYLVNAQAVLAVAVAVEAVVHLSAVSTCRWRQSRMTWMSGLGLALIFGGIVFFFPTAGAVFKRDRTPLVVVLDEGYVDWKIPVYGKYGPYEAGLFGALGENLSLLGCGYRIAKGTVDAEMLSNCDVFIIINPARAWAATELAALSMHVEHGGGLIVLGDHTDIANSQNSLNALLDPYGIAFNFDSGYACRQSWYECLDLRPHPINAGLHHWYQTEISVGATLSLRPPAAPVIVGRYGHADYGNRLNPQGSFLGNYWYDRGERLGDVTLVAECRAGAGKVLVFGDTSPFQNGAFVGSVRPFLANIMAWMTADRVAESSPRPVPAAVVGLGLISAAGAALMLSDLPLMALAITLVAALLFGAWRYDTAGAAPLLPQAERIAWIDTSLNERISLSGPDEDCFGGLQLSLMRNGLLPLLASHLDDADLQGAQLVVMLRPTRTMSAALQQRLVAWMQRGGHMLVCTGYEDRAAVASLLHELDLEIRPVPLGAVPVVRGGPGPEFGPQFREAWPVARISTATADDSITPLYVYEGLAIAVLRKVGSGGLILVADGKFLSDENTESMQSTNLGNIAFIYTLLSKAGLAHGATRP